MRKSGIWNAVCLPGAFRYRIASWADLIHSRFNFTSFARNSTFTYISTRSDETFFWRDWKKKTLQICCIWGSHVSHYEESYVFWYMLPCSPVKEPDVSEEHITSIFRVEEVAACFCWFRPCRSLQSWRWRQYVPPKRQFISKLHGVTTQKTVIHILFQESNFPNILHMSLPAPFQKKCARDV
jgi:hypothetical protein